MTCQVDPDRWEYGLFVHYAPVDADNDELICPWHNYAHAVACTQEVIEYIKTCRRADNTYIRQTLVDAQEALEHARLCRDADAPPPDDDAWLHAASALEFLEYAFDALPELEQNELIRRVVPWIWRDSAARLPTVDEIDAMVAAFMAGHARFARSLLPTVVTEA